MAGVRNLTQAEAAERARLLDVTSYDITVDLTGEQTFRSVTEVRFRCRQPGATVTIEVAAESIRSATLNGAPLDLSGWSAEAGLLLPGLAEDNTLVVDADFAYSHTGQGITRSVDPVDGEVYLHSQFEIADAQRAFACFDQPDLKSVFTWHAIVPKHWRVVSNSPVAAVDAGDPYQTVHFEPSVRMSTYITALCAGPFHEVRREYDGIDFGYFCRASMAPYLDVDDLHEITTQGFDFFHHKFGVRYPLPKYDQLWVPDFNAGAMENFGCVVHAEALYLFRSQVTDFEYEQRANTILHELAHMWFGNLVTMRWWNDLWLNESFATYMSYLAMTKATRFTTGWQDFNQSIKNWAYRQDQLVTTHPISGEVRDTDETFLNFDGITYGKGASVLKQLAATIGEDGFREGTRRYFRKYEYQNATLQQFLGALEEGSGQELGEWARLWLETPSLNTIAAEWDADGDRVSRMVLVQTAPEEYPTLRPHRLDLALVRDVDGRLEVETFPVRVEGRETEVPEAIGRPKPDLVFPNWGDHAYAKIALDPLSAAWVRQNIERVEDTLLRQLLWSSLWNMVRDQQLKSTEFLAIVREKAATEQVELVDGILGQATAALARYVPEEMKDEEGHKLFEAVLEGLRQAPAGDAKIIWMRALIASAIVPEDIAVLGRLADGEEAIEGLTVDQDMRWSIAAKYVAYDLPGAQDRVEREAERDPSDRGQRARLRCETSAPKPEVKHAAWERFNGEGYGTLKMTEAAMSGFLWSKQRDLLEPYVEKFFEQVPEIVRTKDREYYSSYFGALFPGYRVEREILERSKRLLEEVGDELPTLARMLREANDDLARAIACREYAAS